MSTRRALLVWFGCALVGWLFALVAIYGALQFGDRMIASITGPSDVEVTDQQGESVQDIAPAAGDQ